MSSTDFARLRIERRGGLAGLKVDRVHEAAALSAAQRQAVARLLSHPPPDTPAPGADRLAYRLTVTRADGGTQTLSLSEDALPEVLEPLAKPQLP